MLFLHLCNKFTLFLMKSEYQNAIINKIRQLRLSQDVSQFKISTLIGVSTGHVGNIETPTMPHKYTLSQLSMICEELGLKIQDLFLDDISGLSQDETIQRLINCIIEYEK